MPKRKPAIPIIDLQTLEGHDSLGQLKMYGCSVYRGILVLWDEDTDIRAFHVSTT